MGTSIDLSIPDRIAAGLSSIGPSILSSLTIEQSLLLLTYVFVPVRSIREIAVFCSVALIVDFIMQVSFFVTVLSIDIQRLEVGTALSPPQH